MLPNDDRILVLTPTGQDAFLVCKQLKAAGLATCHTCTDLEDLASCVMEGAATAVIAEEALERGGLRRLLEALGAQPAWSDLPIIVLTSGEAGGESSHLLAELAADG